MNLGQGLYSGFDWGRDETVSRLVGSGPLGWGGWHNWGNTQEFQQCDGDWAGSHGNVGYIQI